MVLPVERCYVKFAKTNKTSSEVSDQFIIFDCIAATICYN